VAFNPTDGNMLVSAGYDKTLRFHRLPQPEPFWIAPDAHKEGITSVAFSPTGQILASGAHDRIVKLWSLRNPHSPRVIKELHGHRDGIWTVAFNPQETPQGTMLASGGKDRTVRLWCVTETGSGLDVLEYPPLEGHNGEVRSVSFSPDGPLVGFCEC
jgi:WD40 repeat protein